MTLVSGQVRVAGTGELFLAPVGTALPTTAEGALNAAFYGMGYSTPDGVKLSRAINRDGIMAWQSTVPVRYLTKDQELTAAITFLQSNAKTLKAWLGSGDFASDGDTGFRADIPLDPTAQEYAAVIQWTDGDITSRLVIAKVEIKDTGDAQLARQASEYPITFGALAPDTGNVLASWFTTDPAFDPA